MRFFILSLFAALLPAQEVCPSTPLFSVCDITFDAGSDTITQLHAEMKSPKFKTALVHAFHSEGTKWIIRVAPVDAGIYEFRLTSNVPRFNGQKGSFEATASEHPSFIRPANAHHWVHPETLTPHLWVSGINHQRVSLNLADTPETMRVVEQQVREVNTKGMIADLSLAPSTEAILRKFPDRNERSKWIQLVVSRFAAFDITWLIADQFEGNLGARALLKEIGLQLKSLDPYNHPRSTGAQWTSSPLLADGWMDYINIGSKDDALTAVEHQFYTRPFVTSTKAETNPDAFRKKLWNTTMSGSYPGFAGGDTAALKAWQEVFSDTRFWELQPYFDVDGGRAVALPGIEYIVYVEKPSGPVEVLVEKHGYDIYWINPANGESTKAKNFKGERFVSEPPSANHDWVLHISRDGRKSRVAKSYRFTYGQFLPQEIEQNTTKVPFEITEPTEDVLKSGQQVRFSSKLKRETRATRDMKYIWTGEVVSDGQGFRVLGIGSDATLKLPADLTSKFPSVLNIRLSSINANGKAYSQDKVFRLEQ